MKWLCVSRVCTWETGHHILRRSNIFFKAICRYFSPKKKQHIHQLSIYCIRQTSDRIHIHAIDLFMFIEESQELIRWFLSERFKDWHFDVIWQKKSQWAYKMSLHSEKHGWPHQPQREQCYFVLWCDGMPQMSFVYRFRRELNCIVHRFLLKLQMKWTSHKLLHWKCFTTKSPPILQHVHTSYQISDLCCYARIYVI